MTNQNNKKTQSFMQYILLSFLVALPMLSTDILLPALPTLTTEFNATNIQAKNILVIYMLGFSASILFFGILSDKYGRKTCIKISLIIFLLTTLLCSFVTSINQLIFLRFFQAFGAGSMTVLARAVIRDCFDEKTSVVVLSTISSVMTISTLVAPVIGSFLFLNFGWHSIFIALLCLAGVAFLFIERYLPRSAKIHDTKLNLLSINYYKPLIISAIKSRPFIGYTAIISLVWSAFFCFVVDSSFLLQDTFKLSPTIFAIVFSIISMGYIFGSMTSRRLIHRYTSDKLILLGLSITCVSLLIGIVLMSFYFHLYLVIAVTFIFLVGCGLVVPNCQGRSLVQFQNNIGFYASLFYSIEMLTTGIVSAFKTQLHLDGLLNYILMTVLCISAILIFFKFCLDKSNLTVTR